MHYMLTNLTSLRPLSERFPRVVLVGLSPGGVTLLPERLRGRVLPSSGMVSSISLVAIRMT